MKKGSGTREWELVGGTKKKAAPTMRRNRFRSFCGKRIRWKLVAAVGAYPFIQLPEGLTVRELLIYFLAKAQQIWISSFASDGDRGVRGSDFENTVNIIVTMLLSSSK
jgi:hypothetical protein